MKLAFSDLHHCYGRGQPTLEGYTLVHKYTSFLKVTIVVMTEIIMTIIVVTTVVIIY